MSPRQPSPAVPPQVPPAVQPPVQPAVQPPVPPAVQPPVPPAVQPPVPPAVQPPVPPAYNEPRVRVVYFGDVERQEIGGRSRGWQFGDRFTEDTTGIKELFTDTTIRHRFIMKVYAIVFFQLLITFGFVAIVLYIPEVSHYASENAALGVLSLLVSLMFLLAISCGPPSLRRTFPLNLLMLFGFTVFIGVWLGFMLSLQVDRTEYDNQTIAIAFGLTMLIVLIFTLFALQTSYDITSMGGMLYMFLVAVIVLSFAWPIIAGIWSSQKATYHVVNMVISALIILAFVGLLMYHTQLLLGGKHQYAISPEDYVLGAIMIYMDVVNLFLCLLILVSQARR